MRHVKEVRRELIESYLSAKETVISCGYATEIDWQDSRSFSSLTESEFIKEAAWVVLSSGMRETVIQRVFMDISPIFQNWISATAIAQNRDICEPDALRIFNNPRKICAIYSICEKVARIGFERFKASVQVRGVDFLQELDFIGPITKFHLAKNIGLDVVKPDRHLVRLAKAANFDDPKDLCQTIANITGDKVSVIDIVLWRFATLNARYTTFFQQRD